MMGCNSGGNGIMFLLVGTTKISHKQGLGCA
jgi:hypothetical protein